jgi:hypothetical protein
MSKGQTLTVQIGSATAVPPEAVANAAAGGGGGIWVPMVEAYGEYPGLLVQPDGRKETVVQVIDREGAEKMAASFNSAVTKLAFFFKGLPLYEGHPDDPAWMERNRGKVVNDRAIGRIKEVQVRDDAPWMRVVLNDDGQRLLSGDAPAHTAFSPRFGVEVIPGRRGAQRVVRLFSAGLVPNPNLPGTAIFANAGAGDFENSGGEPAETETETQYEMNDALKKRLGLSAEATPEEIDAAIAAALDRADAAANADPGKTGEEEKKEEEEKKVEPAAAAANAAHAIAAAAVCNAAVLSGKITEAEKPAWEAALAADFAAEHAKLEAKMPTVYNSSDKVGNLGARKGEAAKKSDTQARVESYAKEKGLDLSDPKSYDAAHLAVANAMAAEAK